MKICASWLAAGLLMSFVTLAQAEEGAISIKGSNTFGEELGPRLIAAFCAQHPDIQVELESRGSGSGISALLNGDCDLAATSRALNEDEQRLAQSRGIAIKPVTVGYYGVAVVVHEANPIKGLSDHAIRDVFTGVTTNWYAAGGRDAPVVVLIRDATGGTHLGFQELAMERLPYPASARGFASYTALADAVAADANAVGYVGMNLTKHPGLHALTVNGIPPNDMAVSEGLYPYVRAVRLYVRTGRQRESVERFMRFVRSKEGQRIVESVGFTPVSQPRPFL